MNRNNGFSAFLNRSIAYTAPETMGEVNGELLLDGIDGHVPLPCCDALKDGCPICLCPFAVSSSESETSDEPEVTSEETKTSTVSAEPETPAVSAAADTSCGDPIQLRCSHVFHRSCVKESMEKHKPVCPVCRKPIREPQGFCPSGTMRIELMQGCPCPGFTTENGSPADSIMIEYQIPHGRQKSYHYHPNIPYSGTYRTAYLPRTKEGLALLARLVYAFQHGLIFTVGTSLTTHQPDTVVWTSIHHKTSLHGGPHGFPDLGYLFNCNESLDALYVPDATSCLSAQATNFGDDIHNNNSDDNDHDNNNSSSGNNSSSKRRASSRIRSARDQRARNH